MEHQRIQRLLQIGVAAVEWAKPSSNLLSKVSTKMAQLNQAQKDGNYASIERLNKELERLTSMLNATALLVAATPTEETQRRMAANRTKLGAAWREVLEPSWGTPAARLLAFGWLRIRHEILPKESDQPSQNASSSKPSLP